MEDDKDPDDSIIDLVAIGLFLIIFVLLCVWSICDSALKGLI
jgi:hypothetical protein